MANDRERQAQQIGRQILEMVESQPGGVPPAKLSAASGGRGWLYPLTIGFVAGALVAALLVPDRPDDAADTVATAPAAETTGGQAPGDGTVGGPVLGPSPGAAGAVSGSPVTAGPAAPGSTGAAPVQPAPGAGRAGAAPSGMAGPAPATAAKGVTSTAIKLGILHINDNAITGNVREYYEAEVDRWRKEGLLPVHGRDVQLAFHEFDFVAGGEAAQRAACLDLARDKKVFAVMGWGIPVAAECLAKEFRTPVLGSVGAVSEGMMQRSWPYLFYTNMLNGRVLRNWPHWAHEAGYLTGRKIGLYYRDHAEVKAELQRNLKPSIQQLGYQIASEQAAGQGQGAAAIAVQRFQAAGVNTIFLMTAQGAFTQAAEAQLYRPQYLIAEYEGSGQTADSTVVTQTWVPEQFHNVLGMTYYRRAETGTRDHYQIPPAGKACADNYFRFSGKRWRKDDPAENAAWDSMQHTCDQGRALIKALHAAGSGLSELGLVKALETVVKGQPSGEMADLLFSPTKHDGPDLFKTLKGDKDCLCFKNVSNFRPRWVE